MFKGSSRSFLYILLLGYSPTWINRSTVGLFPPSCRCQYSSCSHIPKWFWFVILALWYLLSMNTPSWYSAAWLDLPASPFGWSVTVAAFLHYHDSVVCNFAPGGVSRQILIFQRVCRLPDISTFAYRALWWFFNLLSMFVFVATLHAPCWNDG